MECSKCRQNNQEYHNYCGSDGEILDFNAKNVVLKPHLNSHCSECGNKVSEIETYCGECGQMLGKIQTKNSESNKVNTEKYEDKVNFDWRKLNLKNFDISNFKNLDIKGIALSAGLTLILSSILIAILNNVVMSEEMRQTLEYSELSVSKFKLFMMNLVNMNGASLNMSFKVALVNAGNISIIVRSVINTLMMILITSISVRVCFNKDEIKGKILEHSISYAIIYSIIMVVIGILSGINMNIEQGVVLAMNAKIGSVFINSLLIGFIGGYMSLSIGENRTEISTFFKQSFKIISIGFIVTSVVLGIISYVQLNNSYNFSEYMRYYSASLDAYTILVIISVVAVLGSWLFTLSNFASFSVLGITSYNIFSLSSEMGMPVVLFVIIPAVFLILTGRKLKTSYRNNELQIIAIFSTMYSIVMAGFAYFSRIIFSANLGQLQAYISDYIYSIVSYYSYEYASMVQSYVDQISSTLNSGLAIGPNIFIMIITSFIFSFICVYLGYKSKKIEQA